MNNKFGRILSYRPNISYKNRKHQYQLPNNYISDLVVKDYVDNIAYNNISKANNILENAEKILLNLQKQFFETRFNNNTFLQYADMVNNKHKDTVNLIYNEAFNDIGSDIVIEVYKDVYNEYDSLINFDKIYKRTNYSNEDISDKESFEIDNSKVNKIYEYQFVKDEKINYAALNYESKLNKIVELKLEISDIYINCLGSTPLPNKTEEVSNFKDDVKTGSIILFNEFNKEYSRAKEEFDSAHDFGNFDKLYIHISNLLVDFYELLPLKRSLFENSGNPFCSDIEKTITKKGEEIDFYILELYKLVAKEGTLVDKIMDMLNKKDQLKKFYKDIDKGE